MTRLLSSPEQGDLLLRNARVRTGPDFDRLVVGSVGIRGGAIVSVGPESAEMLTSAATIVDVEGALVVPGFVDCHTHLGWAGEGLWRANWRDDVSDRASALARVRTAAQRIDPGFWLLGGDWPRASLQDAELPSLQELDTLTGGTPVFLRCDDSSLAVVNSTALELMQIRPGRLLPAGVELDADGRPTGRLFGVSANARATLGVLPPPDRYRRRAELRAALHELARHGITEVHDLATLPDAGPTPTVFRERSFTDATLYDDLAACDQLTARIGYRPHLSRWADVADDVARRGAQRGLITCLGLKELIDDGRYSAPGLDFGYEFRYPGRETTLESMRGADRAGLSVTLHALGDLAVTEALDLFEAIDRTERMWPRKPRIAHARRIAPEDMPRISRLGVTVEAQPWDAIMGMPRLAQAGDQAFLATTSPFRSLLDARARLVFSSDWRISPQRSDGRDMDPLAAMFAAVMRQSLLGDNVWQPEQRLNLTEALAAYTSTAAWTTGVESRRGVVVPGHDADLVVLSRDIVAVGSTALLDARVLLTIVAGRVMYRAA